MHRRNGKAREKTSQALREGAPELRGVPGCKEKKQSDGSSSSSKKRSASPEAATPGLDALAGCVELSPQRRVSEPSLHHQGSFVESLAQTSASTLSLSFVENPTSSKRRRVSNFDKSNSPDEVALHHQLQQQHTQPQTQVCSSPPPSKLLSTGMVQAFTATISADDEEGSNHQQPRLGGGVPSAKASAPASRGASGVKGPRIKLLKKRLERESAAVGAG